MRILFISGKKRAGKDFTADYIAKHFKGNVKRFTLASPLKDSVAKLYDISLEELDTRKNVEGSEERALLQQIGTAIIGVNENFFVDILTKSIINNEDKGIDLAIITDCRYKNEIEIPELCSRYTVDTLRVNNVNYKPYEGEHISETALDDYEFETTVLNDNTKAYESMLDIVMEELNLLKDTK